MTSEIRVVNDDPFGEIAGKHYCDLVGTTLAEVYPGYRWHIEAFPHHSRPFVDVILEDAGFVPRQGAHLGFSLVFADCASHSELRARIVRHGGELLELAGLNRRRFNEPEFLGRTKTRAGLIVPQGAI